MGSENEGGKIMGKKSNSSNGTEIMLYNDGDKLGKGMGKKKRL